MTAIEEQAPELRGRSFKLSVCRTFTLETQLDALRLALSALPCRPSIVLGAIDNIEQQLLDPASAVLAHEPDAVLVLWRIEELHPRLAFEYAGMSIAERQTATAELLSRIESLCAAYQSSGSVPVFLSTVPDPAPITGANDINTEGSPRQAALALNKTLVDLASRHALVRLFDFSHWAAGEGSAAFDPKMDLFARQPISSQAVMSFAGAVAEAMRPVVQPAAKILAVDLDNVLWGGVLGEDGVENLKIGHDFPGNVYFRIQQQVLALKNRGVLLALVSKNNDTDVAQAFARLTDMPLKLNDFAALRVNWNEKARSLREVAAELNVGLDSVVLLDDQAFEREQVMFDAPEVRVLPAGENPLQVLQALTECPFFASSFVIHEDRSRTADYAAQSQRRQLEAQAGNVTSFLKTLELEARVAPVVEATIPRVVQMLAKTNQFNVTTRRHSEADVRRMMRNRANVLLTLSLRDKFADQGIVGLAIALAQPDERTAMVDTLLLSCRAIGRGAEQALWSHLLERLIELRYTRLLASFHRTDKNEQVADLFDRFGMTRTDDRTSSHVDYDLALPAAMPVPSWIDVKTA